MNSMPKAPPVFQSPNNVARQRAAPAPYRPFSVQAVTPPPVYRPQAEVRPNLQLKPTTSFQLERRPAPPVYRPQAPASQLKIAARVVQRMEVPKESGEKKTPEENLENLNGYRPNLLTEVERAFLGAGYNINNIGAAIRSGLQAWGGSIPGHLSTHPGMDSGEQPDTGPQCEKARDYLINTWLPDNPPGTKVKKKGWTDDPEQFNQTQKDQVKRKETKKDNSNKNKHRDWHTREGIPTRGRLSGVQEIGSLTIFGSNVYFYPFFPTAVTARASF